MAFNEDWKREIVMPKHVHAELMKLYAEDAMETKRPWERWQFYTSLGPEDCRSHPKWVSTLKYRRKPNPCPHAELIMQYAKDCQENEKPWELWELKPTSEVHWSDCIEHPSWFTWVEYRRKSQTECDCPVCEFDCNK